MALTRLSQLRSFRFEQTSAPAVSTITFLQQMLLQKDQQVQQLHREKEGAMEKLLREKEAVVEKLLREKEEEGRKLLSSQKTLERDSITLLLLRNQLHLRGAVELAAERYSGEGKREGIAATLSKCARNNKEFIACVKDVAARRNVAEAQVINCMPNIYHTLSKRLHDSSSMVAIHLADPAFSRAEVIGMACLLHTQCVSFSVIGVNGVEDVTQQYVPAAQ